MKVFESSWRTFAVRAVVLGGVVFGAVRFAVARDGVAGGPARSFVTVAGTVTGLPGDPRSTTMRFTFHRTMREGSMMLCSPEVRDVPIAPGGAFAVQVPLDTMATPCPRDMFDGRDVEADVAVGGTTVVTNISINPVPYAHFASVAGQYGTPDCPMGYERATDAAFTGDMRLCQRRRSDSTVYDEVVRVGVGATAFWIDRYEASVWTTPNAAAGSQVFRSDGDFNTVQFPRNGQGVGPAYALSTVNVVPANAITWFQANEACAASGKTLATGNQWLRAARGTVDPPTAESGDSGCRTSNLDPAFTNRPRTTGLGAARCRSHWGAQDMIGNVWEWTDEWYAGAGNAISLSGREAITVNSPDGGMPVPITIPARPAIQAGFIQDGVRNWPSDYNSDGTYNINGHVYHSPTDTASGLPAAALRGGSYMDGDRAGIFSLNIEQSPSYRLHLFGFRCVIPR